MAKRKAKHTAAPVDDKPAAKQPRTAEPDAADQPSTSGSFKNKEKVMVVSSRGITFR
jgi:hypothetical protein